MTDGQHNNNSPSRPLALLRPYIATQHFIPFLCRMPTVTVLLASHSGVQLVVQPNDSLQVVLQQCSKAAQTATGINVPYQPVAVVYSSSNLPVPGWGEAQRAAGAQDVTVMLQAPALADVLSQILQRVCVLEQSVTVLAEMRIINVAAQTLNHAAGELFRTTASSKYSAMGENHTAIRELSRLTNKPAYSIVLAADGVISRRNNEHVHFTSPAALEQEVQQCALLITNHPSLRMLHVWECWVVENFNHFKTAFAPIFDF